MKSIPIILCFAALTTVAHAQLSTGSTGLTVKSGTAFSTQGLVLSPSADITLQNNTISQSATPLSVGSGATIANVYTIAPAITFSGTTGIRYAAGELNGNQENTLSLIKSGATTTFTSVTSSTGSTGTYYVSATGLNNVLLNRVTATSTSVPLPILYHNFIVTAGSYCSLQLSWSADDAIASNFTIERSADGKSFQPLTAAVMQAGKQFTATDAAPLQGRNFYRLAIREMGEPTLYSTILTSGNPCLAPVQTNVYPNPAKESITVDLGIAPSGKVTMDLIDLSGKVVRTFQTIKQVSTLDLQHIAAGSYFLSIQNGQSAEQLKVIKL